MREHLTKESEAQVHLEMGLEAFFLLNSMMASLEAVSYSEVIRRALQACEMYWPEGEASGSDGNFSKDPNVGVKRLHIRVPQRTKERLDKFKALRGGSYSDVLTNALLILAQLIRNREALLDGEKPMDGRYEDFNRINAALG